MRTRSVASVVAGLLMAGALAAPAKAGGTGVVRAGVGVADLSWHVGAGQGQYGTHRYDAVEANDKFDPHVHGVNHAPTDGIQSRLSARALVVEGPDGTLAALVTTDLYVMHDMLSRRVGQLVHEQVPGLDRTRIMVTDTHNHSAPYGATQTWGFWLFADYFDYRHFDYLARQMAAAVVEAASSLRPVRVGAAVGSLDEVQQNILGPHTADDGTPAGFPWDWFDPELSVVRIDDVSGPAPTPYAMVVNLGMHPESMNTNDMISPDFVGVVQRIAGRATGATVMWSQGAVGDSEPDRDAHAHPPDQRREYWHRDYSQAERMAQVIAGRVIDTWQSVETGATHKHVPFSTAFPVAVMDRTFGGPAGHPAPTLSNCRTEAATGGDPRVPAAGLPDCVGTDAGLDLSPAYDAAKDAGVPVPENIGGAPGSTAGYDTVSLHLQVMRLGDILLAACPCEPITDMVRNFKSRADDASGQMHLGFEWPCRPAGADYECNFARSSWRDPDWRPVPAELYARMQAQIRNDASGWDAEDPERIAWNEAEPDDPSKILGNFTHEEVQDLACGQSSCRGYTLPLMMAHANDWAGYVVTYREYMSHDHYRKALTAYGPHTADYLNTRLVRMAAALQGGSSPAAELTDAKAAADEAQLEATGRAAGELASRMRTAYETALPDDGGAPAITLAPPAVQRFSAPQVRWTGGGNYTDNPVVTVERRTGDDWSTYATQEGGEVVVTVEWAHASDPASAAAYATGSHATTWTATYETFEQTPPGAYRFVVNGRHRAGRAATDYVLVSDPFDVAVWSGIDVTSGGYDAGTQVAGFTVAPIDYPDGYAPIGVPYVSDAESSTPTGLYCFRCTFRPWEDTGTLTAGTVTVRHTSGPATTYPAVCAGTACVATGVTVGPGDTLAVEAGGAIDAFGNVNGSAFAAFALS